MASSTAKLDSYKLDSVFHGNTVVHTTALLAGQKVALNTTWNREKKLGAGAFGTVWREKEERSGQLRAVKVIAKLQISIREVEALVELQDVTPHHLSVDRTVYYLLRNGG